MLLYNNISRKIYIYLVRNKEKYKNNNKWFVILYYIHTYPPIYISDRHMR